MLFLSLLSCASPIEAPNDFKECCRICGTGQDPAEPCGCKNMLTLSRINRRLGYTVSPLTDVSIESTGTTPCATDEQYGVALMYTVPHGTRDVTLVNTVEDLSWCISMITSAMIENTKVLTASLSAAVQPFAFVPPSSQACPLVRR